MSTLSLAHNRAARKYTGTVPVKVCMHLLGTARTDYRVMNDATALVDAGFSVTILDVEDEHRPSVETMHGVRIQHIIMPSWFKRTRFKPWFLIKLMWMTMLGIVHLLRIDADIYHAHVERAFVATYITARLRKKPLLLDTPELTMSDPVVARWPRLRMLTIRLIRHIVAYSAGYITGSPCYPEEIRRLYHAREVTVVRHVPAFRVVGKSDRLRQHLGLPAHARIALYQGNIQPNRGLHLLVQSASFLSPNNIIVLMGRGVGQTIPQLQSLITKLDIAERVKIIPPVPYKELLDWTVSADIGLTVYPLDYSLSTRKSLPNKVFEYLMVGLPILTSPLDAIADLVTTFNVGRVVSSLEPVNIAHAIDGMLDDSAALACMRQNALQAAQHEFYWEKERQILVQLYQNIVETHRVAHTGPPCIRVGMHVLGTGKNDVRVMRAATALVTAGFAVSVVDIEWNRAIPTQETIDGIHMKNVIIPDWFTSRHFEPLFFIRAIQACIQSVALLLRTRADVYHAHDVSALPACATAAFLRHKPLLFEAHELPPPETAVAFWRVLRGVLKRLLALLLPHCAGVITVSPPIANYIRTQYHVSDIRLVRNIPPYQTIERSNRLRQYLGLPAHCRIALYQGNIQPNRELDRLVRAATFLEQDIMIILMGRVVRDTQTRLEALITREGVANRIRILPSVPYAELLQWTTSADIGLNIFSPDYSLSIRWCLPNKLFEYLMAGVPVLTSELEAVTEIIRTYDVGEVVSSLQPEHIGHAINTMLADPAALACMRQNALDAARREFCWEKEQQALIHLYQEIVAVSETVEASST